MDSKALFFVCLAVVCFIVTFFVKNRPRYFLLLLVLFAPLQIGWIFRHNNGIYIMDVPLIVLLFYGIFSHRRFRFYFTIPGIAMILWGFFSAFGAPMTDLALHELSRLIRAYFAFLCVINFTRSPKDIYTVLTGLFVGLGLQGLLGYFQWHHGSLGLHFLGESYFFYRARGLFMHPSFFGNYLALLLPIALRLFVFYKPGKKYQTAIYGILFSIGMAALYGSYARGPWIAFAGAVVMMLLFTLSQRRLYPKIVSATAFLVLMGTVFVITYTPVIIEQFTDEYRQGSTDVRMPVNKVAMRVIEDKILLGTGLGNYELAAPNYVTTKDQMITEDITYEDLVQRVHNSYLLAAAEGGIPGFILFMWLWFYVFKKGFKAIRIKNSFISNISLGLLTGFLSLMISLLASPDYREHQILMMFWVLAGFLVTLSKVKVGSKPNAVIVKPGVQVRPGNSQGASRRTEISSVNQQRRYIG